MLEQTNFPFFDIYVKVIEPQYAETSFMSISKWNKNMLKIRCIVVEINWR